MTATFGQHHRSCLRIGSLAVLVATASKGRRVGFGVRHIEQAAIERHQPMATIPRPFALGGTQHMAPLLKEPLQRLDSQYGALIRERRWPCWFLRGLRTLILEPMGQLIPHSPL